MFNYLEKIDILKSVGDSLSRENGPSSSILDREIETLKQEIEIKKATLQYLDEQIEHYEADSEVQNELSACQMANLKEDIRMLKGKCGVLNTYINTLTSDEFPIVQLKNEMDDYVKSFWTKLKPYNDRSKVVKFQLDELRQLKVKYLEAKQRADIHMANN